MNLVLTQMANGRNAMPYDSTQASPMEYLKYSGLLSLFSLPMARGDSVMIFHEKIYSNQKILRKAKSNRTQRKIIRTCLRLPKHEGIN
jgi:hypothetical protein